jgi:UPF0271 protein
MDINCDMGESFGIYRLGDDAALMAQVTSVNIACGFHAGDPLVMQATVRLAREAGVRIGAHPGYPDLQGFGRRDMDLSAEEVEAALLYQLGALAGICRAEGAEMTHIKPHGALYNRAAVDACLAEAVARAAARFSRGLILVGLAGSRLLEAGLELGLRVAGEGFPDRAYNPDGSLRSRGLPGAVLGDPAAVAQNAVRLALEGVALTGGSQTVHLPVETLCLHGDNPGAVENARQGRAALQAAGVGVARLKPGT